MTPIEAAKVFARSLFPGRGDSGIVANKQIPVSRTESLTSVENTRGWWPLVREWAAGVWQTNADPISLDTAASFFAVYACMTLIARDISKMRLRLVEETGEGIWRETSSPAFSPVLRKPNHYQNRIQFIEWWITSKLTHGNTYVLKLRDERYVTTRLMILDPTRVTVLVGVDGSVFYRLKTDNLSGIPESKEGVIVPAREIIHDTMSPLFHPLVGVTPLYACGLAASQGLNIQQSSWRFFGNGGQPGGSLSTDQHIDTETADRLKEQFYTNFTGQNAGKLLVLGDGLKYEPMAMSARDSLQTDQLTQAAKVVCACFHVPPYKIGIEPAPSYNNIEALEQEYYAQALQPLIEAIELLLDEGLELPAPYGTEFDIGDLVRMDSQGQATYVQTLVGAGVMTPNEGRKLIGYGPVPGGEQPFIQEQNWPLNVLTQRDPPSKEPPVTDNGNEDDGPPDDEEVEPDAEKMALQVLNLWRTKADSHATH